MGGSVSVCLGLFDGTVDLKVLKGGLVCVHLDRVQRVHSRHIGGTETGGYEHLVFCPYATLMVLSPLASLSNARHGNSLSGASRGSRLAETARLRRGLVSRKQALYIDGRGRQCLSVCLQSQSGFQGLSTFL